MPTGVRYNCPRRSGMSLERAKAMLMHGKVLAGDLRSWAGKVQHASVVYPALRLMMLSVWRHLGHEKAEGSRERQRWVRLNAELREDVLAVARLVERANPRQLIPVGKWIALAHAQIFVDASTKDGVGGWMRREHDVWFFSRAWTAEERALARMVGREGVEGARMATAVLELLAALFAMELWAGVLGGSRVLLWSDNTQCVEILNRGRAHTAAGVYVARLMGRVLFEKGVEMRVQHLDTFENALADALSHLRVQEFKDLCVGCRFHEVTAPSVDQLAVTYGLQPPSFFTKQ